MPNMRCKCGKALKVGTEHAGRKLKCPECGTVLQVPEAAAAGGGRKRSGGSSGDGFGDSYKDYGAQDYTPKMMPHAKRPRKKKKKVQAEDDDGEKKVAQVEEVNPSKTVVVSMLAFAALIVTGLAAGGGYMYLNTAAQYADDMKIPTEFGDWNHEKGHVGARFPKGFLVEEGVQAGTAPWAKFSHDIQDVVIMIRASISGSVISGLDQIGMLRTDDPEQAEMDALRGAAAYQIEKMKAEYDTYEETNTKTITTGFGKALVSDFNGSKLFMQEVGLRATVLGGTYQYNVICKCPADRLEDYRPMFSKVIESVRNGRAKSLR